MKKYLAVILLFLLVVAGGLVYFRQAKPAAKVTLAMTYIPNVQFAPWYVAEEKGFFREEGLEVVFDYRMDIDALQLVAAGKMDFAIAGGDQVLIARAQEIPVIYLMSLYAEFPPAIIAKAESGIKTAQDLKGKKIGLPLYGTNLMAVKAILKQAGIAEEEVELVDIGYTQIPSLLEDKVDAVVGFSNNEPVKLKAMGVEVTQLKSGDYFSLVGHGLITGATKVANEPEQVAKLVRASLKGIAYALAHPDEAFEICLKHLTELGEEQKAQEREVLKASMALWENDYTRKHGLGRSAPESWAASQGLMRELGLIARETPVEEFLNQSFIP